MNTSGMDRREFHQLTVAALTGVIAGVNLGCNNGGGAPAAKAPPAAPGSPGTPPGVTLTAAAEELIMTEPHTCRGLNSCKGNGRNKENACAGQGSCANVAEHGCSGQNDCKGQGGCGATASLNDCKGQGGCYIPLMGSAWESSRAAFEAVMTKNNKPFGKAPDKAK